MDDIIVPVVACTVIYKYSELYVHAISCSVVIVLHYTGIVSEPVYGTQGESYIAASYVKFIESAGARVVPILYPQSSPFVVLVVRGYPILLFLSIESQTPS